MKKGRNGRTRTAWQPWRICCWRALLPQNRRPGLYREAAAVGYFPAALKAAELLQNGKGGELDADEAYRLLRRVADAAGDPKAMYMLAQVYYTRGDEAQGDSLMKASAQAAYLPAMNRMARLHLLPDSSLPWNPVLSYYYWNQAGEMGDEKAASAAFWLLWYLFAGNIYYCLAFSAFCRQKACGTAETGTAVL